MRIHTWDRIQIYIQGALDLALLALRDVASDGLRRALDRLGG
jgi:hypothetical protein